MIRKNDKLAISDVILAFVSLVQAILLSFQWIVQENDLNFILFLINYIVIFLVILCIFIKGFTKHYLLFSFYLCFFIFLMGQKLFVIPWRENYNITLTFTKTVLNIREYTIFATLMFFSIVLTYYAYFFFAKKSWKISVNSGRIAEVKNSPQNLLPVIRLGFTITFICALIMQLMIVIVKGSMVYTESYLVNVDIPAIIKAGNYLFPFFSLLYLSLRPSKSQTYIVLFLYMFVEGGLQLIQHRRALFATSVLFVVWYLFQYNRVEKVKPKLILKMSGLLAAFIALFYFVEKMRTTGGMGNISHGIISVVEKLMVSTGGSDSVIANTIFRAEEFPKPGIIYLMNPFLSNPLGNIFKILATGVSSGSYGQGMDYLLHNDDFSHWISYITQESLYLSGHGMGSSYIAEIYLALGIGGVALFAIILAKIICFLQQMNLDDRHIFKNVIIMFLVQQIFTLPRNGVFSWVNSFIYLLFGIVMIYPFYYRYSRQTWNIEGDTYIYDRRTKKDFGNI